MRFGFAMAQGPFEAWQQAGWSQVATWIRDDIASGEALANVPLPSWVFDGPVAERGGVHQPEGPGRRRALHSCRVPRCRSCSVSCSP
jgi:3-hydroxyacyl-CoA dehydrogenase